MEPVADARREVALEVQKLAEDFERDDEAAFRRTRIACWVVAAIVTIIILGLLLLGADARYLGVFWLIIVGLIWAGYALSSRRQRQQTGAASGPLPPGGWARVQRSAGIEAPVWTLP
jgi:Flp pilus assembly protein TadB